VSHSVYKAFASLAGTVGIGMLPKAIR